MLGSHPVYRLESEGIPLSAGIGGIWNILPIDFRGICWQQVNEVLGSIPGSVMDCVLSGHRFFSLLLLNMTIMPCPLWPVSSCLFPCTIFLSVTFSSPNQLFCPSPRLLVNSKKVFISSLQTPQPVPFSLSSNSTFTFSHQLLTFPTWMSPRPTLLPLFIISLQQFLPCPSLASLRSSTSILAFCQICLSPSPFHWFSTPVSLLSQPVFSWVSSHLLTKNLVPIYFPHPLAGLAPVLPVYESGSCYFSTVWTQQEGLWDHRSDNLPDFISGAHSNSWQSL